MTLSFVKTALISSAIALACSAASATPVLVEEYWASSAEKDPAYYGGGAGHSVWLPGTEGGADFDFMSGAKFSVFDDGTATLTGMAVSDKLGSEYSYAVDVAFEEAKGTPKKELKSEAYAPDGPVDPSTWSFFKMTSGTLTGKGELLGTVLSLFEAPKDGKHPFQVGIGANGKNIKFGGSGWFLYSADGADCHEKGVSCKKGDFNVNLVATPIPAAGFLLPMALGGLALMRRRRRAA